MGGVMRAKKQRNGRSRSVHSKIPQEENTEKIKVISDISLPNVPNQWSTNNSQKSTYFNESFTNNIQPVNIYTVASEEQISHMNMDAPTNSTNIKVVESTLSNDLFHLIASLDYSDDLCSSSSANNINEGKTSTLTSSLYENKENDEKMSTPESSKKNKQKLQVDVENPSILRDLLNKESHTDMIFDDDEDMLLITKAANIKKKNNSRKM